MNMKFFKEIKSGYHTQTKWAEVGDQLRSNPGLWGEAMVTSNRNTAYNTTSYINNGRRYKLGPGKFEATWQRIDADKYAVYVRLVPEAK
ncbi:hypothetical protein [Bifidobacterium mongoliense]|uniref:Uncharacterized protein n=1 Tax=Bifidobacterium mongoliense TaxID=518643 RepID=A0A423UE41_9BIFI|nr:hypothetical protein [Bifidobacterium mongoliense]ROT86970.1 hypothetical protein BMONG18_0969 [Bifidobacterium mongoliense]